MELQQCTHQDWQWVESRPLEPTEVYLNQWSCSLDSPTLSPPFQWMMNDIFKDLIMSGAVTVYLNDILIMSKTKEEHRRITHKVLKVLWKNKLFLKSREMWVWDFRDRVPQGYHQRRKHLHGSSQDCRNSRVARANQETAATVIPRLYQLLPTFHQRITAKLLNPWCS